MADDEMVPYGLRLLPGGTNLYLTDEAVFEGPPKWTEGTQVEPRYEIPRSVLETVAGVEFLGRIKASLPESLVEAVAQHPTPGAVAESGLGVVGPFASAAARKRSISSGSPERTHISGAVTTAREIAAFVPMRLSRSPSGSGTASMAPRRVMVIDG